MIRHLLDVLQGKAKPGQRRSGEWPRVRAAHLKKHPTCAVCGGTAKLEVHHRVAFHERPSLELDPTNLITLCESGHRGVNCHLWFGHLGNFQHINPGVELDAARWWRKLRHGT